MERVRAMLYQTNLPNNLRAEAWSQPTTYKTVRDRGKAPLELIHQSSLTSQHCVCSAAQPMSMSQAKSATSSSQWSARDSL
jgi:hypothetical protein